MWNTDVLNEHATEEFRAGLEQVDPRSDMASIEFDPYYVNIPFLYHQSESLCGHGWFVRRQRLSRLLRAEP